jgi:hypothetical protein
MLLPSPVYSNLAHLKERPALKFSIQEGKTKNWFFKNSKVAVQLVVTSGRKSCIIAAFPAGNSGIGLWFKGRPTLKLSNAQAGAGQSGEIINFSIQTPSKKLILKKIILNNIRILRNAPPETALIPIEEKYALEHHIKEIGSIFPKVKLVKSSYGTNLIFIRKDFNLNKPYQAILTFPRKTAIKKIKTGWEFTNLYGFISFQAQFSIPFKPLTPISLNRLILPQVLSEIRQNSSPYLRQSLRNLEFLSFKQKFLAGGWRFFTYFGRDTEMTLLMMQNVLTPKAYGIGIQAILNRISPQGEVAHEEDAGSLKEYDKISGKPFLHYPMLDENFLLPILFLQYLDKLTPGQAKKFLNRANPSHETNGETLLKNFHLILSETLPFALSEKAQNLIRLNRGENAGDWRDSQQGLAYGKYPGDVNCWLVPLALRSIEKISQKFPKIFPLSKQAGRLETVWRKSQKFFLVHYSTEQVRKIMKIYLNSPLFTRQEKKYFLSEKIQKRITLSKFLRGETPAILKHGLSFPALSLNAQGKPIPVMNSDPVFELFLGRPSDKEIKKLLPIFTLPYPIGLKTQVGLLVSNPAYTLNPKDWKNLNYNAYQGTVIWVWAQEMLRLGLLKQEKREVSNPPLISELKAENRFYAHTEKELGPLLLSELYTWQVKNKKMNPVPYGVLKGSQTEADAIQLWSSILPAIYMAEHK